MFFSVANSVPALYWTAEHAVLEQPTSDHRK